MKFKGSHINSFLNSFKGFPATLKILITDQRLRFPFILFLITFVLSIATTLVYQSANQKLINITDILKENTFKLSQNLNIWKNKSVMPLFEESMKNTGAYLFPISIETCLSKVNSCFLQKTKPEVTITCIQENHKENYTHQSFNIDFKSSFDFEILDMMEYILRNNKAFGLTRLKKFEIEQLFESEPTVKGQFVYEQLSLNP